MTPEQLGDVQVGNVVAGDSTLVLDEFIDTHERIGDLGVEEDADGFAGGQDTNSGFNSGQAGALHREIVSTLVSVIAGHFDGGFVRATARIIMDAARTIASLPSRFLRALPRISLNVLVLPCAACNTCDRSSHRNPCHRRVGCSIDHFVVTVA